MDSTSLQMASLHLLDTATPLIPVGSAVSVAAPTYDALYMTMVGKTWEVRVANSTDLMNWHYIRTLLPNADMPYAFQLGANGWVLVVHEQWMNPGSRGPSQLGFKLYYNTSDLIRGVHFNSFVAPLSVGRHTGLEGTPNVYAASLVLRDGHYVVDAQIGFHYNNEQGVDQVAHGTLTSFGPTRVTPSWTASSSAGYDHAFISAGAVGNIGPAIIHFQSKWLASNSRFEMCCCYAYAQDKCPIMNQQSLSHA